MIIQGRDRPKYTASCITKLIIPDVSGGLRCRGGGGEPVARVSFLHQAYHVAHNFSGIDNCELSSEIEA
jgi:hypothetical protein